MYLIMSVIGAFRPPFERVQIPWEGKTLDGYFRKPNGPQGKKYPVVIPFQGADTMAEATIMGGGTYTSRGMAYLVVAGLKATPNGHVVVIVPGPAKPYPTGYWGRLHGVGRKNTTINWAWDHTDLPNVKYFAVRL